MRTVRVAMQNSDTYDVLLDESLRNEDLVEIARRFGEAAWWPARRVPTDGTNYVIRGDQVVRVSQAPSG